MIRIQSTTSRIAVNFQRFFNYDFYVMKMSKFRPMQIAFLFGRLWIYVAKFASKIWIEPCSGGKDLQTFRSDVW